MLLLAVTASIVDQRKHPWPCHCSTSNIRPTCGVTNDAITRTNRRWIDGDDTATIIIIMVVVVVVVAQTGTVRIRIRLDVAVVVASDRVEMIRAITEIITTKATVVRIRNVTAIVVVVIRTLEASRTGGEETTKAIGHSSSKTAGIVVCR